MRRLPFAELSLLLCVLALAGCASSGGGGDDESSAVYRESMGQVVLPPLQEAREKIWQRHNIHLYREESAFRSIYYESEWIPREPTPEEVAAGATSAGNRVVIRGRRAGETMDGVPSFSVTHEVQNQVRTAEHPEWHPAPMPEPVLEEYRRIYADLRMEVQAGIRR